MLPNTILFGYPHHKNNSRSCPGASVHGPNTLFGFLEYFSYRCYSNTRMLKILAPVLR